MEKNNYSYENPNHFSNLNDMRLAGKLCDVTIKVDDREIRAHKIILAANLKYFEIMFMNSFQECTKDVITMKNVKGSDLETLITYAYTGEIVLTDSNALGLLDVANYVSEDSVRNACIDFLKKHLQQEEACRAYIFANAIECFSLKHVAKSTILSNFRNCSQTTGFFNLDVKSLKDILSSASLGFIGSEVIFESLVRWVASDAENRRTHVNDLLNFIEITTLPADWLLKYLCSNVQNRDFAGIVDDIMIFYNNKIQRMEHQSGSSKEYLIVTNRIKNKNQICNFQFYDLTKKKWSLLREFTISNSDIVTVHGVVLKNKLYFIINAKKDHGTHLQVFNPTTKQCEVLTFDRRLLGGAAICACTSHLYFCGGYERDCPTSMSDQILKYDPRTNSFKALPPMGTKRAHAAAVFHQGCLHVLGGHDGPLIFNTVEKYDRETKRWTTLAPMCEERYVHAAAVLDGKLYACGGESKKSVEVYDPEKNSWQLVADMKRTRHDFILIVHEGKLWAVGGGGDKADKVEVYDPSQNQWKINFQMDSRLEIRSPAGGVISSTHISDLD